MRHVLSLLVGVLLGLWVLALGCVAYFCFTIDKYFGIVAAGSLLSTAGPVAYALNKYKKRKRK